MEKDKVQHLRNEPLLRFKNFTNPYFKSTLRDLGEVKIGLTYSPTDIVQNNGTLVLRSSNIQNGKISTKENQNVYVNTDIKDYEYVRENDILICSRNGSRNLIGKNAIIKEEHLGYSFGAFMSVYRTTQNPSYIHHLINTQQAKKEIHRNLGATINQITSKNLLDFRFYIANNQNEQEIVATFLNSVDKKISMLEYKLENLKLFNKGLFANRYDEENRIKLGEVCNLQGGYAFQSSEYKKTGIPILRITNVDEFITQNTSEYKYSHLTNIDNRFAINNNDLLIAMSGATAGKVGMYVDSDKSYLNQRVGKFMLDNELIDYRYLFHFLKSHFFRKELSRFLVAGAQPNISGSDIENIRISLPTLDIQRYIGKLLDLNDSKIRKIDAKLETLKQFKKGLLQQMFI